MPTFFTILKMFTAILLTMGFVTHVPAYSVETNTTKKSTKKKASINKEHEAIKKAVLEVLKDPESAKFKQISIIQSTKLGYEMACVTVNSRNRMGGYAGFREMTVAKISGRWVYTDMGGMAELIAETSHDGCLRVIGK